MGDEQIVMENPVLLFASVPASFHNLAEIVPDPLESLTDVFYFGITGFDMQ